MKINVSHVLITITISFQLLIYREIYDKRYMIYIEFIRYIKLMRCMSLSKAICTKYIALGY